MCIRRLGYPTKNSLNRLTKIDHPTGVDTLFEYDGGTAGGASNKGQLTKITDESGTTTFTYSDRGRLASAKVGTNTVTYLYNALEQRLKKAGPTAIVPTGANYYVYDLQGQIIGEYNATNKVISETVYLGATPVALIKQTIAGSTTTTTANYIYADQIDTPRVITRASDNKMVWRWDQADPFGLAGVNESAGVRGF